MGAPYFWGDLSDEHFLTDQKWIEITKWVVQKILRLFPWFHSFHCELYCATVMQVTLDSTGPMFANLLGWKHHAMSIH